MSGRPWDGYVRAVERAEQRQPPRPWVRTITAVFLLGLMAENLASPRWTGVRLVGVTALLLIVSMVSLWRADRDRRRLATTRQRN